MPLAQLIISLISPLLLMRLLAELFCAMGLRKGGFLPVVCITTRLDVSGGCG